MRTLIRIVFVIFIAKGIDCLGGICDNCCECFKEKEKNKKKEIKEDENIAAKSLVNDNWYNAKKENLVLMIFKKEEDNDIFTSTENGDKISIKSDEKGNPKIAYQDENEDKLKLQGKKYALFEIKIQEGKNTVYLYCSDVESSEVKISNLVNNFYGIFGDTDHVSISVIACDTENVSNMAFMFSGCSSLKDLKFSESFNTTKVTGMKFMFSGCSSLTELDLNNFDTTNVTDMSFMFLGCSELKKINFGQNFNTTEYTDMSNMFNWCTKLPDEIKNKFSKKKEE